MSPDAREQHLRDVIAALQRVNLYRTEGRPHFNAKVAAADTLAEHFRWTGRTMYIACNLAVRYPDEAPFAPDVLVVADLPDAGVEDDRVVWGVADEGRGPDLVLEFSNIGDSEQLLVANVALYSRLHIPEYIAFDLKSQQLHGFRISSQGTYVPLATEHDRLLSQVLDLTLAVVDGRLRFFQRYSQHPLPALERSWTSPSPSKG